MTLKFLGILHQQKILLPRFIKFPQTTTELDTAATEFEEILGYPMCIGALDGSHIPICPPKEEATDHYCYKGIYSMVLFAVVDAQYRFTYIRVGSAGRNCDSYIFQRSILYKILQSNFFDRVTKQMGNTIVPICLIGDSAFPLRRHLMKPYADHRGLTAVQAYYNRVLSGARRVVENTFGRTKARFRVMYKRMEGKLRGLREKITACCVLNNVCEYFRDMPNESWKRELSDFEQNDSAAMEEATSEDGDNGPGKDLRDAIAEFLYNNQ